MLFGGLVKSKRCLELTQILILKGTNGNNVKVEYVATQHYSNFYFVNEQNVQHSMQHTSDYKYSQLIG